MYPIPYWIVRSYWYLTFYKEQKKDWFLFFLHPLNNRNNKEIHKKKPQPIPLLGFPISVNVNTIYPIAQARNSNLCIILFINNLSFSTVKYLKFVTCLNFLYHYYIISCLDHSNGCLVCLLGTSILALLYLICYQAVRDFKRKIRWL